MSEKHRVRTESRCVPLPSELTASRVPRYKGDADADAHSAKDEGLTASRQDDVTGNQAGGHRRVAISLPAPRPHERSYLSGVANDPVVHDRVGGRCRDDGSPTDVIDGDTRSVRTPDRPPEVSAAVSAVRSDGADPRKPQYLPDFTPQLSGDEQSPRRIGCAS